MVCPVCVTSAIVANIPVISASIGGIVAAKIIHKQVQSPTTLKKTEISPKETPKTVKLLPKDSAHE
jgi:hypothetical protein